MKYYKLKNPTYQAFGIFNGAIVTCIIRGGRISITFAKYSDEKAIRDRRDVNLYNCISTVGWFVPFSSLEEVDIE